MAGEVERSRGARAVAEEALVRVIHHYGGRPEIVVLGGLVPDLLCSKSGFTHAGTTDVDVQVNHDAHPAEAVSRCVPQSAAPSSTSPPSPCMATRMMRCVVS